jgi:hypothetical protein
MDISEREKYSPSFYRKRIKMSLDSSGRDYKVQLSYCIDVVNGGV